MTICAGVRSGGTVMLGTIVVGIILAGIVALAIRSIVNDKKAGRPSCGVSGCSGCAGACSADASCRQQAK